MGDPAGCAPEITCAAWNTLHGSPTSTFFVIADPDVFQGRCPVRIISDPESATACFTDALPVLPLRAGLEGAVTIGKPNPDHAAATIESISTAASLCLSGSAAAMVTNPISKAQLYKAGFRHPGHTEFIASLCTEEPDSTQPVMMLVGGGLRVALATIHVPLRDVPSQLTTPHLIRIGRIVGHALRQDFGIASPRIALTGLNPHAGEDGTIGREEVTTINPAAEALRLQGFQVSNARPADTVFHEALTGQYDAIIAMTHDQGLIPVKTLDLWGGVNTTLGLPLIRTSPDHGTAYDAAAAGTCRPDSLISAIRLARDLAINRAGQHD